MLLDGDYFTALLNGIDRAREEIFLSAYLFRTIENAQGCPEAVLKSLIAAVGRGVRVEAILERNRDADDLNRNNAETAERLRQGGIRVCLDAPDRQTHTKLVVIDRRYVLIGSHNLTQSALKYNHEASVWIDSAPLAEEALRYMKSLCPEEGSKPEAAKMTAISSPERDRTFSGIPHDSAGQGWPDQRGKPDGKTFSSDQ